MKRIIIERIIVYVVTFIFFFTISSKQGSSKSNVENEFFNNIADTMEKYNYTKKDWDLDNNLDYSQGNNKIHYRYYASTEEIKIKNFDAWINLNFTDDLNDVYKFLNELYKEDISIYNNKVQKMISDFKATGKEQMLQDLSSDRQLTLIITKTDSLEKDYELCYSITNF